MTTYAISNPIDRFSWNRCLSLWYFYEPALGIMLWLWPVCVCVLYLGSLLPCLLSSYWAFSSFGLGLCSFLIVFSPLMLARVKGREATAMLPVTPGERLVFLLLFFCVFIPVIVELTEYALYGLSIVAFGADRLQPITELITQSWKTYQRSYGLAIFASGFGIIVTMCAVTLANRNKVLLGVVACFGSAIVIGIISGIGMMVYGFLTGLFDSLKNSPLMFAGDDLESLSMINSDSGLGAMITWTLLITAVLSLIIEAICVGLMYRKFKKGKA